MALICPRVLYLFAGERKRQVAEWLAKEAPDSYLIGLNHLKDFGVEAEYFENKIINWLRRKNFNLTNLALIFKIRHYDIVFTGASLSLVFLVKVILRFSRPKFVFYNTYLTNILKRNTAGWRARMIRKTVASLDAIVCPSLVQKKFLIEQKFDPKKIFFIPVGIDWDFFQKFSNLGSSKGKYILSVGKDLGRDYKTLIEAVRDLDIEVKIIAWPRNFKNIEELPSNVSVKTASFKDLAALYQQALFFVLPTKKESHFDASDCSGHYALLDAMASGLAIIASRRTTLDDYLSDGQEGKLVPPEDASALRAAIQEFLAAPELVANMGQWARKKAELFTTKNFAQQLALIFKELAAK